MNVIIFYNLASSNFLDELYILKKKAMKRKKQNELEFHKVFTVELEVCPKERLLSCPDLDE